MRQAKRSGFTLIEVLTVVGIIGVLSAIITTAGIRAMHASKVSNCMSNLDQIGLAAEMYTSDHDGYWPPYAVISRSRDVIPGAKAFKLSVLPYGAAGDIFYCPLDPFARQVHEVGGPGFFGSSETSYEESFSFLLKGNRIADAPILSFLVGPSEIQNPAGCTTFEDALYNVNPLDYHSTLITGHGNRISMLFLDGHTKEIPVDLTTGHCDGAIPASPTP